MAHRSPTADPAAHRPFEEDLRASLHGFRAALADAVAAVHVDATRPQQLARELGLDKSLAWHLSKILTETEVLATASHVPGRTGLRIVTESFERAGATPPVLAKLEDAIARFERMVEVHCGSRSTLRIMSSHLANGDGNGTGSDEAHRRKLVEGASGVWGVHAKLQLAAQFLVPSAQDPATFDAATIAGFVGFRRLRDDVSWAIASLRRYADDGTPLPADHIEPVDVAAESEDDMLLRAFCTTPMPRVRAVRDARGFMRYELAEGPIGATGECTCFAGWISRAVAEPWRTEQEHFGEHLVHLNTPVDLVVHDLFVHRDLPFVLPPEAVLYGQLPGALVYPQGGRDRGQLPLAESVIDLGAGPPDVTVPELPQYRRLVEAAVARLGCAPSDFRGYRLRLRFPPIPTILLFRHTLPVRPHRGEPARA